MKSTIHRSDTRGHANHGWLDSYHSFSFGHYFNPDRMRFGLLRVLNDDTVAAGRGFDTHPHSNMEIISIPLEGDLEHRDSMGNVTVIQEGDIQVMSAGTGVSHSEYNKNSDREVKFLQIWVFPNRADVTPRYDQISINELVVQNQFSQILSPREDDQGVWIHQDAWFSIGEFNRDMKIGYQWHKEGNGLYVFVIEGEVGIGDNVLRRRDAMGIRETDVMEFEVRAGARLLLMEVPMG